MAVSREQIFSVVKKHLMDALEGLKESDIDPTRSMKDYGANSLDMVEVVSRTMRELKIKVPRAELAKLTNLNGLIDLLHRIAEEKAKSESKT
jgi:acyl carrier protein